MKFITYFRCAMSSTQANALPATFLSLKWVKTFNLRVYLKPIKKKYIYIYIITKLSFKN